MYLTSYQGMGTANVTCVSGCTCQPKQGVASWPMATSSVFQLVGLIVSGGMLWGWLWRATLRVSMDVQAANLLAVLFTVCGLHARGCLPSFPTLTTRPLCTHNAGFMSRSWVSHSKDCSKRCGQQLQACLCCNTVTCSLVLKCGCWDRGFFVRLSSALCSCALPAVHAVCADGCTT